MLHIADILKFKYSIPDQLWQITAIVTTPVETHHKTTFSAKIAQVPSLRFLWGRKISLAKQLRTTFRLQWDVASRTVHYLDTPRSFEQQKIPLFPFDSGTWLDMLRGPS
ncbi:hypothetical protein AVEN_89687-1 [Araneus ventricosus]|uniref:Uncharacterized protein n=1 Tax=Araneus ventricosus TaxID=182803 RepID=A0A4Y2HIV7_ARAVE|nr:hypothetical protein AVEN_89687-1 [Araneus ventricosus]